MKVIFYLWTIDKTVATSATTPSLFTFSISRKSPTMEAPPKPSLSNVSDTDDVVKVINVLSSIRSMFAAEPELQQKVASKLERLHTRKLAQVAEEEEKPKQEEDKDILTNIRDMIASLPSSLSMLSGPTTEEPQEQREVPIVETVVSTDSPDQIIMKALSALSGTHPEEQREEAPVVTIIEEAVAETVQGQIGPIEDTVKETVDFKEPIEEIADEKEEETVEELVVEETVQEQIASTLSNKSEVQEHREAVQASVDELVKTLSMNSPTSPRSLNLSASEATQPAHNLKTAETETALRELSQVTSSDIPFLTKAQSEPSTAMSDCDFVLHTLRGVRNMMHATPKLAQAVSEQYCKEESTIVVAAAAE